MWPGATVSSDGITNAWVTGSGAERRAWRLETYFRKTANGAEPPIFTQQDFPVTLAVSYSRPMPKVDYDGVVTTTTEDMVTLRPCPPRAPSDILREYSFTTKSGARIDTKYYWPKEPTGVVAGYTAPLVQFVETKISGLTPNPITLTSAYSQTYHPYHHNFSEEFVFEPRLDPNVSASDVAALEAANIRLIYVLRAENGNTIKAMSPSESFRDL
jgi:hypothetical protein